MNSSQLEYWLHENIGFENAKLGLERIKKALSTFGIKPKAKIITVAGTNGKGSTSRLIANTLKTQYRVSLFTSPHLKCITERFLINNEFIHIDELFYLFQTNLNDLKREGLSLSYFEFLFFVFIRRAMIFEQDFIVLEVGLGGRFDATNSLDADISIITSISRDHIDFLGNSYKKILAEKVGVARNQRPLITAFELNYLNELLEEHQKEIGFISHGLNNSVKSHLFANFKEVNLALANRCLELLEVGGKPVENDQVKKYYDANFYFHGSHNLDAVRKLVHYLKQNHYTNVNKFFDVIYLSFSKRDINEIMAMISQYKRLDAKIILSDFDHFKALDSKSLIEIAKINGINFVCKEDIKLPRSGEILVSGSNYFIGSFSKFFNI